MNLDALFKLTNGLYILGTKNGDRFVGSLVDAVTQVAHDPCILVLSCTNGSYTKQCIEKNDRFSLSVLGKNISPFILGNFGFQSSRNVDKWNNVNFYEKDGLPYLSDNLATISCRVLNKMEFSSNMLFIAEIVSAENTMDGEPLTYRDYRHYLKDDVLKSFNAHKKQKKEEKMSEDKEKKWVCNVCGYVYDGDVPFEELSNDWLCPLCGVDKSFFELKEV